METQQKFRNEKYKPSGISILKLTNMTLAASTIIIHASFPFLYSKWGLSRKTAYTMALFSIVTPVMYTSIDKYTSPTNSYEKNFKIIKKNNYSDFSIYSYLLINGFLIHFGLFAGAYPGIGYKVKFDHKIPLIFLSNLALTEIIFFKVHELLHTNKYIARLHILHHCIKYPGWLGNILFHPIDIIMELGSAIVAILLNHTLFFKNKFATPLSTGLIFAWYLCDHDENIRLPHTKHHLTINGWYGPYTNIDAGTKGELVRKLMA